MEATLIKQNGRMKIRVNEEIIEPMGFMTYNPDGGQFGKMAELGCSILFFGAYATDQGLNSLAGSRRMGPHFYLDYNTFDFTEIDRILELCASGGEGPYLIPRVYFSAPKWWEEQNPEETCRNQAGESERESFGSAKWREDMWSAIKALIDHIEGSKWRERVIGYHLCAGSTEEWTYHGHSMGRDYMDYSEGQRALFAQEMAKKYGTIKALNAAWGKNLSSFEEIAIPRPAERAYALDGILRRLPEEQNVIDHAEFLSNLMADTILWFCRRTKEYTQNRVLTGAFYGYHLMHTDAESGHFALQRVVESPDIDFLVATLGAGSICAYNVAVDTVRLHDKLFIGEGDVRTHLSQNPNQTVPWFEPNNSYYQRGVWVGPPREQSVGDMKRTAARTLCGMAGLWWFDMWGGWFEDPAYQAVIQKHSELLKEQTEGPIRPEVALIIDEAGLRQFKHQEESLRQVINEQRRQLSLIGAPYHIYTAADLADPWFPVEDYKLYVMAGFCRPTAFQEEVITAKLKAGGRTLVWTHFAGIDRPALTDFNVAYDQKLPPVQCQYPQADFPTFEAAFLIKNSSSFGEYPKMPVPVPRFAEGEAEAAYVLGRLKETDEPALLWKQKAEYASVYSLLPGIPYQVLREIARMSGVHLYSVTGDALMAGGKFIALRALSAGEKRIQYPFPVKRVTDAYTDEEMEVNEIFSDFIMEENETRVFRIE